MVFIDCKTVCEGADISINRDLIACVIDEGEKRTRIVLSGTNNSALVEVDYKDFMGTIKKSIELEG